MLNLSEYYEAIYESGVEIPGYDRYWKYYYDFPSKWKSLDAFCQNEESYWALNEGLQMLDRTNHKPGILEVGCGLGYLTWALNNSGYSAVGLDISEKAVSLARDRFGEHYYQADLSQYVQNTTDKYDIITLIEVIEHLENPVETLHLARSVLKPGGKIILSTPNKTFFDKRVIWGTDQPPIHLWWFSEESVKYIAEKSGFTVQFIDFSKYHKKKYRALDMRWYIDNQNPPYILDEQYRLITDQNSGRAFYPRLMKRLLRTAGSKLKFLKRVRDLINPDIKICRSKSVVLGAVLST